MNNKTIIKKSFRYAFRILLIYYAMVLLVVVPIILCLKFFQNNYQTIIIATIIICFSIILFGIMYLISYIHNTDYLKSVEIVDKKLNSKHHTSITPLKLKAYSNFLLNLTEKQKLTFTATINPSNNKVNIYVRVTEDNYNYRPILFDEVSKEEFLVYYRINEIKVI